MTPSCLASLIPLGSQVGVAVKSPNIENIYLFGEKDGRRTEGTEGATLRSAVPWMPSPGSPWPLEIKAHHEPTARFPPVNKTKEQAWSCARRGPRHSQVMSRDLGLHWVPCQIFGTMYSGLEPPLRLLGFCFCLNFSF